MRERERERERDRERERARESDRQRVSEIEREREREKERQQALVTHRPSVDAQAVRLALVYFGRRRRCHAKLEQTLAAFFFVRPAHPTFS